ncbi:hypothetical protein EV1_042420 [Malus domestica]
MRDAAVESETGGRRFLPQTLDIRSTKLPKIRWRSYIKQQSIGLLTQFCISISGRVNTKRLRRLQNLRQNQWNRQNCETVSDNCKIIGHKIDNTVKNPTYFQVSTSTTHSLPVNLWDRPFESSEYELNSRWGTFTESV